MRLRRVDGAASRASSLRWTATSLTRVCRPRGKTVCAPRTRARVPWLIPPIGAMALTMRVCWPTCPRTPRLARRAVRMAGRTWRRSDAPVMRPVVCRTLRRVGPCGGFPTMSHVIPRGLFQILKLRRCNSNVFSWCSKVTGLNYVRDLWGSVRDRALQWGERASRALGHSGALVWC